MSRRISCNETYEPQVDFGDKTYVNDYSGLIEKLSDQLGILGERLKALTSLVDQVGAIKVSIDENTGAIQAFSTQMSNDLQDAIYSLLSGFNSLNTVIEKTGEKIVFAVNDSGEVIALHLDQNGSLVSAAITTKADELVKAINDQNRSISDRLDSLNVALSVGLARIEIKIGADDSIIEAGFKSLNCSLAGINKTLFNGFCQLKCQIQSTGNSLVYAVNKNGETIAFHIDSNGNLISVKLVESAKLIADALNSQTATLGDKLKSLTSAVTVGLMDISVKLGNVGEGIEVKLSNINETLGEIDQTILDGYTLVATKLDENGDKVVWAVNKNGETIALHLDQNGNLISVAIRESAESLRDIINSLNTTLSEKLKALNEIIGRGFASVKISIGKLGTALDAQFTDMNEALDGINTNLLDGFTNVQTAIDDNGEQIVLAIDRNGESIVAEIDESGKLIAANVLEGDQRIVTAIASLDTDLGEKIDALGKLIYNGLADIQVAINEGDKSIVLSVEGVSDELKNLKGIMEASLAAIDSDLQLLNTTQKETGETIVSAINSNGELISLAIGANGELISATITASVGDLVKVINSWKASFEEKLDALNALIEAGFANIGVKLGEMGSTMDVQYKEMNEALKGMNQNLLNGFTVVAEAVGENGTTVAAAVNDNGTKIVAQIDESGKLIAANVLKGDELMVEAIADFQSDLGEKVDALNSLLKSGLADISTHIDGAANTIKFSVEGISGHIDLMKDLLSAALVSIDHDLDVLNETEQANGTKLVNAINSNGQTLTLKIDEMGKLLSVSLDGISTSLSQLKDALEDQNKGIAEKLDALNQLLKTGIGDIKVAIENLGTTLNVDLGKLEKVLGDKLDGVINGIATLSTKVEENGTTIATAINDNGEIIEAAIDANGELLNTTLSGKLDDIITALNNQSTSSASIATKLDGINTTVETGLGTIKASIDDQTDKLDTRLSDINDNLDDANGNLADMVEKLGDIDGNLTDGFKALADSLGKMIINLGEIKIAIDNNTQAILTLDGDVKLKLQNVADSLSKVGGKLEFAINKQGDAIVLALGKDGEVVKAINLGTAELSKIEAAILANGQNIVSLITAGNKTSEAILKALGVEEDGIPDIIAAIQANQVDLTPVITELQKANKTLTELLAISDGIYLDSADKVGDLYNYIYITADVKQAADNSSQVNEGLLSLLVGKTMSEPTKVQYCSATADYVHIDSGTDSNWHSHCFWKKIEESKPFLKNTSVVTDIDNKTLLKMEKYYSESVWLVKIHDVCSYAHIYSIFVNDARTGGEYVEYYKDVKAKSTDANEATWNKGYYDEKAGVTYMGPIKVKFVSYKDGVFCDTPQARIFCQLTAGSDGKSSSKAISDKSKDNTPYPSGTQSDITDDGWWTTADKYHLLKSISDTPISSK